MGLGSMIGSAFSSALDAAEDPFNFVSGIIPKACLYVRECAYSTIDNELSLKTAIDDAWKLIDTLKHADGTASELYLASYLYHYRKLEVQYNPASISFKTSAGKSVRPMGGDAGGANANQIVQVINPVATVMDCQIILDDMNVFDAFLADGMTLSTGGALSAAQSIGRSMAEPNVEEEKDKKGYSVQAAAEGILSLLLTTYTRQVIFSWNQMFFRGELTNANVRYTMFNSKGHPIRAVINLTIRQGDEFAADEKAWKKAFDKAFGKNATEDTESTREEAGWYEQILNLKL